MSMFRKEIIGIILLVTIFGAIPFLQIVFPTEGQISLSQPKLQTFLSYEDLVVFLNRSRYSSPYYVGYRNSLTVSPMLEASSASRGASLDSFSVPEYSETNIQVEGVDEADIIKCDGEYLYLVSGRGLLIVKAYPPEDAEVSSRIQLNGTIRGIFVNGNKLAVFSEEFQVSVRRVGEDKIGPVKYGGFQLFIRVYNIEDKSEPVLARNVTVDGSYFNSRMIGNYVYALITTPAYLEGKEASLPSVTHNGYVERIEASSIYYSNVSDYYYTYTTIIALNIQNDEEDMVHKTFLFGSASGIYVSLGNIYVAIPKHGNEGTEKTEIHRIYVENGEITPEASGEVPGYVLNQFSMDEYDGNFRIATTTGHVARRFEEATSKNHVYILNLNLTIVGKLEKLAPGEKIYSARFMGKRCYLVTFKKIDPLFVISLDDPTKPTILGKLKIPGYSDYLHPYDENHLIGIGKNTVEAEEGDFAWYQGVKISLFDVSDVEHPKEIANFTIGDRGTDSPVLRDHKALLFSKNRNLLAIPVLVVEIDAKKYPKGVPPNAYGDYIWQGAYIFNITDNDIALRGRITHIENKTDFLKSGYWFFSEYSVKRVLYIGNVLYTISNNKIKMNDLTDLQEINELELP